jgi:hypothetical protein
MLAEWNHLPENLQIALSREALQHAVRIVATQAEVLAAEFDNGTLRDRGGSEALRLFAAVVRVGEDTGLEPAGHG